MKLDSKWQTIGLKGKDKTKRLNYDILPTGTSVSLDLGFKDLVHNKNKIKKLK